MLQRKVDIAYFIVKQNLAFANMPALEERHGVNIGTNYKYNKSCAMFLEYIALSQ